MDPSPAFPSKLDAGLTQDSAAKPMLQKDTVLLEIVKMLALQDKQHWLSLLAQHFCHHPSATAQGKAEQ